MSNRASIVTQTGAQVLVNGQLYTASPDHANFKAICKAIQEDRLEDVPDLTDLRSAVRKWLRTSFSGDFQMVGDLLRYKDYTFGDRLTGKALAMIDAGNNAKPLLNFLAKVCQNPSMTAREELLLFCEANGFMIASNGNIVAYKAVQDNFTDFHSGTVRYMVGDSPSMDRGKVDDDRDRTCSRGLHFAAHEYAKMFGGGRGHMMVLEVNPADVVAIPSDYANQKGRAWKVYVIAEIDGVLPKREVYDYNAATESWGDNAAPLPKDDDDDLNDDELYDLGWKHGRNHRPRKYDKGYLGSYDAGYSDGRSES